MSTRPNYGYRYDGYDESEEHSAGVNNESPLFQRLNDSGEITTAHNFGGSGLHQYGQKLVQNQSRIRQLERINTDLEARLEEQARQCLQAERACVDIEKKWRSKYERIEAELRDSQKQAEAAEQKSQRLREHLSRTERELYGLLQRKYELMKGGGGPGGGGAGGLSTGAKSWNAIKGGDSGAAAAGGRGRAKASGGGGGGGSSSGTGAIGNSGGTTGSTLASLLGFGVPSDTTNSGDIESRVRASARARLSKTDTDIDELYDLSSRQLHSREIRQRRVLASLHDFLSGGT